MPSIIKRIRVIMPVALYLAGAGYAGVTNTVPWSESFESYPAGLALAGTNGWGADSSGVPVVTNGTGLLAALQSYTNTAGHAYPLAGATHTNVLRLASETTNQLASATTSGVVRVDLMALPGWCAGLPEGRSRNQLAAFVWTNGLLSVWQADTTASPVTNAWLNLTNSPVIGTDNWVRLTFVQDYASHMFQVGVDGRVLTDGRGWSSGGASPGGSWFHMAATNSGGMSRLIAEAAPGYLDDVSASMRQLAWSRSNFVESALDDGSIDNGTPLVVTLSQDTFAGTVGEDLALTGKFTVSGLPSNLVAVARLIDSTSVQVTLANRAAAHQQADSVGNLVMRFTDQAFTLGRSYDVAASVVSGAGIRFNAAPGPYNQVPFTDDFEGYAQGTRVGGLNGWSAVYRADAGSVTNDDVVNTALQAYLSVPRHTYPVSGGHLQTLRVLDEVRNEIHSGATPTVYVDFMMIPVVAVEAEADTNNQIACYVNTNLQVVVWHSNRTSRTCEWLVLSNAPAVSTSAWMRFTFQSDYTRNMYQLRLNEGDPISSPQGWTQGGAAPTGSWFYMAQTQGAMSRFKLTGGGTACLDDVAVRDSLPGNFGGGSPGSVYLFR